ncbi:MAG TPA: class F sortase [Acidimicrobiia bacterium]|nr:class F sortase [Acidimicrobiia bacterium]
MSRIALGLVAAVCAGVLVGAPLIWLAGRPAASAGDHAAVVDRLMSSEPAIGATDREPTNFQPTPAMNGSHPAPTPFTTVPTGSLRLPEVDESEESEADLLRLAETRHRIRQQRRQERASLLGFRPAGIEHLDVAAPPAPVRVKIEAIGVDAAVAALGIDPDNGQMDVPPNVSEVGWYRHGPVPGEAGSSVMAAHVDLSGPGRGVFWSLGELEPGDRIIVAYADGTSAEFSVEARNTYLKTELPLDAIFARGGTPVLTLVTCGGGFNTSIGRYDSNVVVYAVPVVGSA